MSTDSQARGGLDLDRRWALHPQVSVRPEPFGALLYHFATRRLSFLKDPLLLRVVQELQQHPTARAACAAAGVGPARLPSFAAALTTLARTRMIIPDDAAQPGADSAVRPTTGDDNL
ncbi:mycofactocin biosynthesis chaperone MftB [Streptomyces sp. NPDC054919]